MNTRNLRKRRKAWAAVVYVPNHLQELAAQYYNSKSKKLKEVVRGLGGERDLKKANKLKLPVIAKIQAELAALEDNSAADYIAEARELAKSFDPKREAVTGEIESMADDVAMALAPDIDEHTEGDHPEATTEAQRFYKIATGQFLPISEALDRWEAAADGVKVSTFKQYKSDIKAFIEWSKDIAVQDVTEDLAARWWNYLKTTPTKNGSDIAPATLNRKVGSLNRLWKWMKARKVHKGENFWSDLLEEVPGEAKAKKGVKILRSFTKPEIKKYLKAIEASRTKYKRAGLDIVTLLWHTGIRPGDLSELTKDRVLWDEDGVAWITLLGKDDGEDGGKSDFNARIQPVVSPEAVVILKRRVDGVGDDGKLFHDIAPVEDSYRYFRVQKVINPICHKALPDVPVETYSARRSFSGACEDAGLDPVQWSRLMGHTAPTLAAAVYNRGHKARKRLLLGITKVHAELGELADTK